MGATVEKARHETSQTIWNNEGCPNYTENAEVARMKKEYDELVQSLQNELRVSEHEHKTEMGCLKMGHEEQTGLLMETH